jgi:hypothetical protein
MLQIESKRVYVVDGHEFETIEEAQTYAQTGGEWGELITAYLEDRGINGEARGDKNVRTRTINILRDFLDWQRETANAETEENIRAAA